MLGVFQAAIYTAGAVYVSLTLIIAFALGGPGLEKFLDTSVRGILELWAGLSAAVASLWAGLSVAVASLWDKLPELVEQTRKSAVSTICEPWHLAVFYSALLALACYRNWEETKNISQTVFEVVMKMTKAVGCFVRPQAHGLLRALRHRCANDP